MARGLRGILTSQHAIDHTTGWRQSLLSYAWDVEGKLYHIKYMVQIPRITITVNDPFTVIEILRICTMYFTWYSLFSTSQAYDNNDLIVLDVTIATTRSYRTRQYPDIDAR